MPQAHSPDDMHFMTQAIRLAAFGLGQTAPNPSVGCVIVNGGQVVGTGTTSKGGRPHAEVNALKEAGKQAKGATAYVSLEPCSHTGKSPPCTDALIKAGISKVVYASHDPNPLVNGQGRAKLEAAGVSVISGLMSSEADEMNSGFFLSITEKRPRYTVKIASSLDGKIATSTGESKWITGPEARRYGHSLRANNDAILVGIDTVQADDPMLDCRIAGLESDSPARIILDTQARIKNDCQLIQTAENIPTYLITEQENISFPNVTVIQVDNIRDVQSLSRTFTELGFTRVLIEGGPTVQASFICAGLCDELYWFRAPIMIGQEGKSAIGNLALDILSQAQSYELREMQTLGADLLERRSRKR